MLRRVRCCCLSMIFFAGTLLPAAQAQTNAERQAAIDGKIYQPAAYQALLDELHRTFPDYKEDIICGYVYWAYNDLRAYFKNVSLYQVLTGITDFSRLMQRDDMKEKLEGPHKLEKMISLYLVMKEGEGREKGGAPAAR